MPRQDRTGRNAWVHRRCTDGAHNPALPREVPEGQPLLVKRVEWRTTGKGGKIIRSRTLLYQCSDCVGRDADYNRVAYTDSPGLEDMVRAGA